MSFDIRFVDRSCAIKDIVDKLRPAAKGNIMIGNHREDFYSMLDVWQCARYEEQWQDALQRLRRGLDSCFVVNVHPPVVAQFIECWLFWRLESEYRVQNQCMFFEDMGPVDPANPYDAIWPYSNETDDGERIYDDWGLPLETFAQ